MSHPAREDGRVYVAGTCDTKSAELRFACERLNAQGIACVLVDLSTTGGDAAGDVPAHAVAALHPDGPAAVFCGDRGRAVAAMAVAFRQFLVTRPDVAGVMGLGGSGNTVMVTEAMRALPVGVPKLMVSTLASGQVSAFVGASDIMMLHSVVDISGLNRISRRVIGNAAHAMAGMVRANALAGADLPDGIQAAERPAIGLTMFGVTTPCVQRVRDVLQSDYDCLVFHATGTGGMAMEKLADSRLLSGIVDLTTTEIADLLVGGVLACTEDRLGAVSRTKLPYVGACGALDMVNFGALEDVPAAFRHRNLYVHNPQVTLMRTTATECEALGRWIGARLNACDGPVRFLMPEGGLSAIDVPGQAFYDPQADAALFAALEATVVQSPDRRLQRVPCAINDPAFADAVVAAFAEVMP